MKQISCKRTILIVLILIYFIFLIVDYKNIFNTDKIKFISIVLCFVLTFSYREIISNRDIVLLRVARLLTIITDYFLLLTDKFYYGVLLFSIVQIIYIYRHAKVKSGGILNILLKLLIGLVLGIQILYILDVFRDKVIWTAVVLYGFLIIGSTIAAYFCKNYGYRLAFNRKLVRYGMILFLLCDISVGLTNYFTYLDLNNEIINNINNVSRYFIWVFYLPSQVLLSLSGEKY
ncbi:hypothetical protein SH2C18_43010 [Clostridium sediminicola]|uniref:lysoplasmalogenase family protein n=1 Tax=Clostridium sediminicola TaxID=3114879 RepID=UPI0031F25CD8